MSLPVENADVASLVLVDSAPCAEGGDGATQAGAHAMTSPLKGPKSAPALWARRVDGKLVLCDAGGIIVMTR